MSRTTCGWPEGFDSLYHQYRINVYGGLIGLAVDQLAIGPYIANLITIHSSGKTIDSSGF